MLEAARGALADAAGDNTNVIASLTDRVDTIACVEPFAWAYESLARGVADKLGLRENITELRVPAGGNSPQDLLHDIAARIAGGESDCALLTGAESVYSRNRARREGVELDWPKRPSNHDFMGGQPPFSSDLERRHGMRLPIQAFPMFENAIQAASDRSPREQIELAARLLARNATVAAGDPYAWFRDSPTAEEIATVNPENRMICYPYTKRMNAIMDVDQGAALLILSETLAREMGMFDSCSVVLGGAGAEDAWYLAERREYSRSVAMNAAVSAAFDHAAVTATDMDAFDLYSCFPSAIEFGCSAASLSTDDPRPLTLTGGLAYAGGPGNAYVLCALAAGLQSMQAGEARRVLVTGVGMACAKLTATVLSRSDSIPEDASGKTPRRVEVDVRAAETVETAQGNASVETWTVEYDRDGSARNVIYIVSLEDGRRTVANSAEDPARTARDLLERQPIGRTGTVHHEPESGINRLRLR